MHGIQKISFNKTDILLWSLFLGGANVHLGNRQPVLLYFDFILIIWLLYYALGEGFSPDFSGRIISLGFSCILVGVLSAIVNYHDIFKSLAALKVLMFGLIFYAIAKKAPPTLPSLVLWGALAGVLLLINFQNIRFNEFINPEDMKASVAIVLGRSNYIASMLVLLIPLGIAAATIYQGKLRLLFAGCSALMFAGLISTFSRGAMLALALATLAALPLMFRSGLRLKYGLLVIGAAALVIAILPSQLMEANAFLIAEKLRQTGDRPELFRASWESFLQNPVLGVGPGQLGNAIAQKMLVPDENPQYVNAHNLVLNALAEYGFFAGAALVIMVALVLYGAWKQASTNPTVLTIALFVAILAAVFHNMVEAPFEGQQFQVVFWAVAGMGAAIPSSQPTLLP